MVDSKIVMQDLSKAIGYCRVSTQRQHLEGHGLERYIHRLKEYGLSDEQIHWDIESGASEKRKGYNRVLELVRAKKIDKLIVPCFDRFTRSALGWEKAREELQQFGVEVVFLDGGSLDLDTPEGVLTSRILAAFAANVRDKNKYNATQGHRYFQEKRKTYRAIFGFIKYGDNVTPNLKEYRNTNQTHADIAREAIQLFLESGQVGGAIRALVNKYGVERVGTATFEDFPRDISAFRRWLQHPQLCGRICYYRVNPDKKIVLDGDQEGIISVEIFNEVQAILAVRPSVRKKTKNPLCGLVKCGICGSRMELHTGVDTKSKTGKDYKHFRCTGYYNRPGKPKICQLNTYFPLGKTIDACIRALQERSQQIGSGYAPQLEAQLPPEVIELRRQILDLQRRNDPDLESAIIAKEQRLENLIRTSELNYEADASRNHILQMIASDPRFWDGATDDEVAMVFQELVSGVACSVVAGKQVFAASIKI